MAPLRPIQIGNITIADPVILAPMTGVTDLPFRTLVASFGAGLVVSEMVASVDMIGLSGAQGHERRCRIGADA